MYLNGKIQQLLVLMRGSSVWLTNDIVFEDQKIFKTKNYFYTVMRWLIKRGYVAFRMLKKTYSKRCWYKKYYLTYRGERLANELIYSQQENSSEQNV